MVHPIDHRGLFEACFRYAFFISAFLIFHISHSRESAQAVSIMAYNVENLFDATDDGSDQGDPTFLPMSIKQKWAQNKCLQKEGFRRQLCETLDWTQDKYEQRLKKISQLILEYNGSGPDIIVFEELENKRVIMDLWDKFLKSKGYQAPIHIESPSNRGIDVGMISRFTLSGPVIAHPVDLSGVDAGFTRDILEATFLITPTQKLKITANHWPSLSHTVETRLRAAAVLKIIAKQASKDSIPFIAMGDFNTLPTETPNPIANNVANNLLQDKECPLVDIQNYIGGYLHFPSKNGSHYYKGEWSPLDRIIVSKSFFDKNPKIQIDLQSFGDYIPDYLLASEITTDPKTGEKKLVKFPRRFDFMTGEGYSDHLPVVLKLNLP